MNKKVKSIILSCVMAVSLFAVAPSVSASTVNWKETKTVSDTNKAWTVTFNDIINSSDMVDKNLIYVIDESTNNKVDMSLVPSSDSKSVQVKPSSAYGYGTYKLVVSDKIRNASGKTIKQGYNMEFNVSKGTTTTTYFNESDVSVIWNDSLNVLSVTVKASSDVFGMKFVTNDSKEVLMKAGSGNVYDGALAGTKPTKITIKALDEDGNELQSMDYPIQ